MVVDSFAAIFRTEFSLDMAPERSRHIVNFGSKLKSLSDQYNCPIVCVNQVSDNFKAAPGLRQGANVVPALGLVWANTVNVRLMLSRWSSPGAHLDSSSEQPESAISREIEVIFAPHLPPSRCRFTITEMGVSGVAA